MLYYEDNDVKYKLDIIGGMLGENSAYRDMIFDTKEEAQEKARLIRKSYSPAQKKYYGLKIVVRPERAYEKKIRLAKEKESYMYNGNRVQEKLFDEKAKDYFDDSELEEQLKIDRDKLNERVEDYFDDSELEEQLRIERDKLNENLDEDDLDLNSLLNKVVDKLEDNDNLYKDDFELEESLEKKKRILEDIKDSQILHKILGLCDWLKDRRGESKNGEFALSDAGRCLMGIMREVGVDNVLFHIKKFDSSIGKLVNLIREKIQDLVISAAYEMEDDLDGILYNHKSDSTRYKKHLDENLTYGKATLVYTIFRKLWNKNKEKAEDFINETVTHFGYDEKFLLNKYTKDMNLINIITYNADV